MDERTPLTLRHILVDLYNVAFLALYYWYGRPLNIGDNESHRYGD